MIEKTQEMVRFACELELGSSGSVAWESDPMSSANYYSAPEPEISGKALEIFRARDTEGIINCYLKLALSRSYITSNGLMTSILPSANDGRIEMVMDIAEEYYKILQGRFGKHISKVIYKFLVVKLAINIESHLIDSLGVLVDDKDSVACLVEESPEISVKRAEFNTRLLRLRNVRRSINGL